MKTILVSNKVNEVIEKSTLLKIKYGFKRPNVINYQIWKCKDDGITELIDYIKIEGYKTLIEPAYMRINKKEIKVYRIGTAY